MSTELIESNASRWLENFSSRNSRQKRILLHGINVYRSRPHECDNPECTSVQGEDLEIPAMSPLVRCAEQNPDSNEFQWLAEDRKWVAILPNINGG